MVESDELDEEGKKKLVPLTEEVELWKRDPVELIKELMGNPAFKDHLQYAPYKVFEGRSGTCRAWDEMATAEWWWYLQVRYTSLEATS